MFHTNTCVISAFQYDGDFMNSDGVYYVPKWAQEALSANVLSFEDNGDLYLNPKSGGNRQLVHLGDYVALLPNDSIIAMNPVPFEWLFRPTDKE